MVRAITVPKLGQLEEEATLLRWVKKEGEAVAPGEVLFEIETDKAVLEVESFFAGTLLKVLVREGQTVPVQAVVGYIGDPGEAIPEGAIAAAATQAPPPLRPEPPPREMPAPGQLEVPASLRISPRAARLARESGIDPALIPGTGPGGRIVEHDVQAYLEGQRRPPPPEEARPIPVHDAQAAMAEQPRPLSRMRQAIAARLSRSFSSTPHFFVTVSVDMT